MACGLLGGPGVASTRSSKVPLVSSMRACSSPGQSPRRPRSGRWAGTRRPSESARRRAGSTVTTQARRPARAACRAKVAATVVLPTPPGPQHTTTGRSAARDRSAGDPAGPSPGRRRPRSRRSRSRGRGVRRPRPGPRPGGPARPGRWPAARRLGSRSWGRGSSRPSVLDLLGRPARWRWSRKRAGRLEGRRAGRGDRATPARPAAAAASAARPAGSSSQQLTTTGPSWTPARSSSW